MTKSKQPLQFVVEHTKHKWTVTFSEKAGLATVTITNNAKNPMTHEEIIVLRQQSYQNLNILMMLVKSAEDNPILYVSSLIHLFTALGNGLLEKRTIKTIIDVFDNEPVAIPEIKEPPQPWELSYNLEEDNRTFHTTTSSQGEQDESN